MTESLLPAVEQSSDATVVVSELRTPAVERSSGEETVTEGLFPTAERSLEEGTSSMRVGLRPSVEAEPATSSMLPVERPSGEVHATDIASGLHAAIGAHPPVDRASTNGALTEPRRASRSPSEYRALARTDTEVIDPVMIRRRRELNELEQSIANTQDERTRLQLYSTEISTSLVAVR